MKVAILGGSFDPIHQGHLEIAKYALVRLAVDEVWFLPTKKTPLKSRNLTSFHHRCQMIQLTIYPYRKMKLCKDEDRDVECSYTIDTVTYMKKKYPNHQFIWLIGSDQAQQLASWKDIHTLLQLVRFHVFLRNEDQCTCPFPVSFERMPLIDVSSTQIRKGMKLHMLADSVRCYIGKHGLYLSDMIQSVMCENRYRHSVSVAELSKELAISHGVDEHKAYLAGLLHDVCKEWPYEKASIWMQYLNPSLIHHHKNIWHAYIAAQYVKRYYRVRDKQICHAIKNHVQGSTKHKLSMIVYIADKLDPLRGYDSKPLIDLSKKDLKKGYEEVQKQQALYLKRRNRI